MLGGRQLRFNAATRYLSLDRSVRRQKLSQVEIVEIKPWRIWYPRATLGGQWPTAQAEHPLHPIGMRVVLARETAVLITSHAKQFRKQRC